MTRQLAINLKYCNSTRRVTQNLSASRSLPPLLCSRCGQLISLGGNFEKAAYSLNQVSVQVSLNTNVYCDELEDISDLKNFLNASVGHWKRCGGPYGPWAAICPSLLCSTQTNECEGLKRMTMSILFLLRCEFVIVTYNVWNKTPESIFQITRGQWGTQ